MNLARDQVISVLAVDSLQRLDELHEVERDAAFEGRKGSEV